MGAPAVDTVEAVTHHQHDGAVGDAGAGVDAADDWLVVSVTRTGVVPDAGVVTSNVTSAVDDVDTVAVAGVAVLVDAPPVGRVVDVSGCAVVAPAASTWMSDLESSVRIKCPCSEETMPCTLRAAAAVFM